MGKLSIFQDIWLVDVEFNQFCGENPTPTSLHAHAARGGRDIKLDLGDSTRNEPAPIVFGERSLLVAYDAVSVLGCFLSLGWKFPVNVLSLEAEFRCHVSGLNESGDWSLAKALEFYGVEPRDDSSLVSLLERMSPIIDVQQALLRGRYTAVVAIIERNGIPLDLPLLMRLRASWDAVRASLIEKVDERYGVFDGTTFKADRWRRLLAGRGVPWPKVGALDDDTFKTMAAAYPEQVGPIWELRKTLNKLRVERLAVGSDGRNRTPLRPFASRTGRNQPSTSRFIFGSSAWIRGLIRPELGMALAYLDYEQQEFGIAAALSGDEAMGEAYRSGDPYLAFARQAGAVPRDATKETHHIQREQFKLCSLGIQYGMGVRTLANLLKGTEGQARELIASHKAVYRRYWEWSRVTAREARTTGVMRSVFGWRLNVRAETKSGTIKNFPLQANGAEMLRLACCLSVGRGIRVCAPIHDAVLIEGYSGRIEEVVADCQGSMAEAARIVLGGFQLRTEVKVIRHPARYIDKRGGRFWDWMMQSMGRHGTSPQGKHGPRGHMI